MTDLSPKNSYLGLVKQLILLTLVCLCIGFLLKEIQGLDLIDRAWVDRNSKDRGLYGVLYFVLMGAGVTAIGGPRQLVAFLGGYAYGFVYGSIVATLAAGLGCVITFYFSRFSTSSFLQRFLGKKIGHIDRFLIKNTFTKTIIIRLFPVGSNLLTNVVAGASRTKFMPFWLGSLLGYYPQMAIFALMGKGMVIQSEWRIGFSIILLVISSLLSILLYRHYKNDKELVADIPVATSEKQ
jgi:uncharacterized membrane protein YdjX (TVP38/TMEM64 family)